MKTTLKFSLAPLLLTLIFLVFGVHQTHAQVVTTSSSTVIGSMTFDPIEFVSLESYWGKENHFKFEGSKVPIYEEYGIPQNQWQTWSDFWNSLTMDNFYVDDSGGYEEDYSMTNPFGFSCYYDTYLSVDNISYITTNCAGSLEWLANGGPKSITLSTKNNVTIGVCGKVLTGPGTWTVNDLPSECVTDTSSYYDSNGYGNIIAGPITVTQVVTPPLNLTAKPSNDYSHIDLSWTPSTSTDQTAQFIERATSTNPLTIYSTTSIKTTAYTDSHIKEPLNYYDIDAHYPAVQPDGSTIDDKSSHGNDDDNYANNAISNKVCVSELKMIYDLLPDTLSGKIPLPAKLSTLASLNSGTIKQAIADANLSGQPLNTALQNAIGSMSSLDPGVVSDISREVTDSVINLGKNYGLTPTESGLLFSGIISGDTPFNVISFSFKPGPVIAAGFYSKFLYQVKKSVPTIDCIGPSGNLFYNPPSVTKSSKTSSPNTHTLNGSGFSSSNNSISLTPSVSASGGSSSLAPSKNTGLLASIGGAYKAVTGIIQSVINVLLPSNSASVAKDYQSTTTANPTPTPVTTEPATTTQVSNPTVNGYYEIDGVPSDDADGTSITFTVPNTVPDGVYTVGAASEASDWTQTPFTITVTGNGVGDPTTIIGTDTGSAQPLVSIDSTSTTATSTYLVWYSPSTTTLGYEVRETSPDVATIVGTTTNTSFLWSGLKPGTNYCVYVYTLDSSGTNATSSTCFTTLLLQPGTLTLKSINWNNLGNIIADSYYNPKVNFGGDDSLPYNDDVTATEWCKHVPGASYTAGTSHTNWANPQDGIHYSFDGTNWIAHDGGDYPRWYECTGSAVAAPVNDQSTGVDVYAPVTITTLPVDTTTTTQTWTPAFKKIFVPSSTTTVSTSTSGPALFATSTTDASTIYVWDGGTVTTDCGLGYVMVNGVCQFGTDSNTLSSGGSNNENTAPVINGAASTTYTGVYDNKYYNNGAASTTYTGMGTDASGNNFNVLNGVTCPSPSKHFNSAGNCVASSSLIEI